MVLNLSIIFNSKTLLIIQVVLPRLGEPPEFSTIVSVIDFGNIFEIVNNKEFMKMYFLFRRTHR